jgi:hypothetical protein
MSLSYTLSHALTISNAHKNAHSQNIKTRQKNVPFKNIEDARERATLVLPAALIENESDLGLGTSHVACTDGLR